MPKKKTTKKSVSKSKNMFTKTSKKEAGKRCSCNYLGSLWAKVIFSLIISVMVTFFTYHNRSIFANLVNFAVWLVCGFYIFKRLFLYLNSFEIPNWILLWLIRLFGLFVALISAIIFFMLYVSIVIMGFFPITVASLVMSFYFVALGFFMILRCRESYEDMFFTK